MSMNYGVEYSLYNCRPVYEHKLEITGHDVGEIIAQFKEFDERYNYRNKLNKLAKFIYSESYLNGASDETLKKMVELNSCSGKTTSLAFSFISKAMAAPNVPVVVIEEIDVPRRNQQLLEVIEEIVEKLDYKFFEFDYLAKTVTFEI
jgi:hypothetical protein